jgi:hypothetical protein
MSQTLTFNQEPILIWKKNGVYIYEKGYEYDKNIFIYYQSLVSVNYGETKVEIPVDERYDDKDTHYVRTHLTISLSNGMIVNLEFADEAPYIYQYFQDLTNGFEP